MIETFQDFKGEIPKRSERLLPPGFAVKAVNCKLQSGEIRPFGAPSVVRTPSKGSAIQTMFLFKSVYWLNWLEDVDVALSPVKSDIYSRFYWTGEGAYPKKSSQAYGASDPEADLPENHYRMGVIAPATKPDTADDAAGGGSPETRVYVYTYVTAWGEEGQPSPPSTALEVEANETVTVDNFEAAPAAIYNITYRRIYRTLSGSETTTYQFVAEIAIATTSYADSLAGSALGEQLPSISWAEPNDNLAGLVLMGNGVMAGFVGKDLYFSEPYRPHAWPPEYALVTEHDIVALGVMGRSLVVATAGNTYLVYGEHPSVYSIQNVATGQPCISKRGLVEATHGVLYPSPNGMFFVSPSGGQIITQDHFTKDEWEALGPENLVAALHQGRYYGFFGPDAEEDRRGIIFDPGDPAATVVFVNQTASAVFADLVTNILYLMLDGEIKMWEGDAGNPLAYKWRGNISAPMPINFGAAAVQADLDSIITEDDISAYTARRDAIVVENAAWWAAAGPGEALNGAEINAIPLGGNAFQVAPGIPAYSMQLSVYADGELKHQQFIQTADGFRLPSGFRAREWEFEIEGMANIQKIQLANTMIELKTG